MKNIRDR